MTENWQTAGFGLYIHWPFCQAKCPYCDFNSHVVRDIDQDRWKRAYISEIRRVGAETQGRVLASVFFGGGTPSLMDANLVADILDTVKATWPLVNDPEITLEANPSSVESHKFFGYRDAGVNRLSLGIQSLNDIDLKALGRLHSVLEARAALETAQSCFDRVSFDLIYARPNQSLSDWTAELQDALSMGTDHLSLYQLSIEKGTAFGDRFDRGKLPGLPDEDLGADMFLATQEICESRGYPGYEVSNHARTHAESRHNLIYWRSGDYLGIGPGAHGRVTFQDQRYATDTALQPFGWLQSVETMGSGEKSRQAVSAIDRAVEYLMMALRLREGACLARVPIVLESDLFMRKINELGEDGFVELQNGTLSLTARGRPLLNPILGELLTGIGPS